MTAGGRNTPVDMEDSWGKYGDYRQPVRNDESVISGIQNDVVLTDDTARTLGRECYESSTNWLNSGRRLKWNDSLRAFQGLHPNGSKYLSGDYRYRSRLFRPKTRSMVRKGEASTAAAFFSNADVVNIQAQDDDDKLQLASATFMQSLIQYRLTKTIPWFLTVVGARQDAEVMGICIGKPYWKYGERYTHTETRPLPHPMTGQPYTDANGELVSEEVDIFEKIHDHPCIDLIAPENFRFDPGADWRNPIATSPYTIELIPMYVADVREKCNSGEWLKVSDSSLMASSDLDDDVTRRAREQGRVPGKDNDAWKPREFDICWVRENILRYGGRDWHFYSLAGAGELLTKPEPVEKVYLQGVRPYVCGFIIPEAHKTYPSAKVELIRDLQTQTNDTGNLRLDNVKLALNPRQFVAMGKGIDPQDVRVFNPGKVVMTKDPRNDVFWDRPPDVTAGAYQEQDRINLDFDELTGGVSNSSIAANPQTYKAVGNMELMDGNASQIEEYEQRVFAETFVEPIMNQLVKLEQAYETDPMILAIAGRDAQLIQKFGINEITDELLQQQLTTKVNVGIGATNPKVKLQNFMTATQALGTMFGEAAALAANPPEIIKEVFSLCGYKDGDRFFMPGTDIHQLIVQSMQSKGGGKGAGASAANNPQLIQMKAQADTQSKIAIAQAQQSAEAQQDQEARQNDMKEAILEHHLKMEQMQKEFQLEMQKEQLKMTMQHQQEMRKMAFTAQNSYNQPRPAASGGKSSEGGSVIRYDQQGRRVQNENRPTT